MEIQPVRQICRDHRAGSVCIARDTRASGPFLAACVSAGVMAEGLTTVDLGVAPTPACAALVRLIGARAGLVISASHNPAADNGIKVFDAEGAKLMPDVEQDIERVVADPPAGGGCTPGRVETMPGAQAEYMMFLARAVPHLSLKGMHLVVDCAHGATYETAPDPLADMGAELTVLFDTPDGTNINAGCGSQHLGPARDRVRREAAHAGLVFDGDGDRVMLIDERGAVVDGDRVVAMLAIDRARRDALPGGAIVCTDYSNKGLDIALSGHGVACVRGGVGDRDVLACMRAQGYTLGGEQSGHIILSDVHSTGDGIMTALHVLELMRRTGTPLSELAAVMTPLPQVLLNVEVAARVPLAQLPGTRQSVARASEQLADRGRVYVRYSGTENLLRVMVEGEDETVIRAHAERIAATARTEISTVGAPA